MPELKIDFKNLGPVRLMPLDTSGLFLPFGRPIADYLRDAAGLQNGMRALTRPSAIAFAPAPRWTDSTARALRTTGFGELEREGLVQSTAAAEPDPAVADFLPMSDPRLSAADAKPARIATPIVSAREGAVVQPRISALPLRPRMTFGPPPASKAKPVTAAKPAAPPAPKPVAPAPKPAAPAKSTSGPTPAQPKPVTVIPPAPRPTAAPPPAARPTTPPPAPAVNAPAARATETPVAPVSKPAPPVVTPPVTTSPVPKPVAPAARAPEAPPVSAPKPAPKPVEVAAPQPTAPPAAKPGPVAVPSPRPPAAAPPVAKAPAAPPAKPPVAASEPKIVESKPVEPKPAEPPAPAVEIRKPAPTSFDRAVSSVAEPHLTLGEAGGESFFEKIPMAVKIGVVLLALAIGGYFVLGRSTPKADETAGAVVVGEQGWSNEPVSDVVGSRHGRILQIYRPSVGMTDYKFQFAAQIESKAIGWCFREQDTNNYYGMKIENLGPGKMGITHFAVVEGRESGYSQRPLAADARPGAVYQVMLDVTGPRFTVYLGGEPVDFWTDNRLKAGAVGFMNERDERGATSSVRFSFPKGVK